MRATVVADFTDIPTPYTSNGKIIESLRITIEPVHAGLGMEHEQTSLDFLLRRLTKDGFLRISPYIDPGENSMAVINIHGVVASY